MAPERTARLSASPPLFRNSFLDFIYFTDYEALDPLTIEDAGDRATARRELQKARTVASTSNAPLTQREMEVLRLIAKGLSEREVADRLFISPHTAHRHLSNIRLKLNATTQAAAVALAVRIGLI